MSGIIKIALCQLQHSQYPDYSFRSLGFSLSLSSLEVSNLLLLSIYHAKAQILSVEVRSNMHGGRNGSLGHLNIICFHPMQKAWSQSLYADWNVCLPLLTLFNYKLHLYTRIGWLSNLFFNHKKMFRVFKAHLAKMNEQLFKLLHRTSISMNPFSRYLFESWVFQQRRSVFRFKVSSYRNSSPKNSGPELNLLITPA